MPLPRPLVGKAKKALLIAYSFRRLGRGCINRSRSVVVVVALLIVVVSDVRIGNTVTVVLRHDCVKCFGFKQLNDTPFLADTLYNRNTCTKRR